MLVICSLCKQPLKINYASYKVKTALIGLNIVCSYKHDKVYNCITVQRRDISNDTGITRNGFRRKSDEFRESVSLWCNNI